MGTSLEGLTEDILAVVGELHSVPSTKASRVYTVLKLDGRDGPARRSRIRSGASEDRLGGDAIG